MRKIVYCQCGNRRDRRSKSKLCFKCWLEKVRNDSPYINGSLPSGGSQWKNSYGQKHYELNKGYYIRKGAEGQRRIMDFVNNDKNAKGCIDCGIKDCRVLDYDHKPGEAKKECVCNMVKKGLSIKTIKLEIGKCEVRCANCHRIKTSERRKQK